MVTSNLHASGLARIILINSYIHSETGPDFFEFDFRGHTQVNGANGSGKTSLLKLIPFFYGIEPGRITSSSGVRKNFSGYYLPYADSAIIFEYYAGNGNLVHVAVTNAARDTSNRGLMYRFVPCGFEAKDAIIYDNTEKKYRIRDWSSYKQVLRNRGIKSESLVYSVDAYRSIIQNIATPDNARLRADYSLSTGRRELRFIDGIALSLITGRISFDNIKLLLTEILRRDHSDFNLELRESDIVKWCNDAFAFRAIEEHREKLEKAAAAGGSYKTSLEALRIGAARLKKINIACKERLTLANEKLVETEKARNSCRESSEHRHTELSAKVATTEAKVKAQIQKVSALEERQAYFEANNAQTWMHELENRVIAENEAQRCRSLLKTATSQVADIRHEFELRKSEASRIFLARKVELEQALAKAREQAQSELAQNDKKFREDNEKARAAARERTDNLRMRMAELKAKSDKLNFFEKHTNPTPELLQTLESARNAEQNFYSNVRQSEKELRALTKERNTILSNREQKARELEKLACTRNEQKQKFDQLKKQTELGNDTLASFLCENITSWQDSEGKVLAALLERTDLKPRLLSKTSASELSNINATNFNVGRLLLDISPLTSPELLTDKTNLSLERLSDEINNTTACMQNLEQEIAELEDKNASLSGRILELESFVSTDDKLEELKNRTLMAQHDIDEYIKQEVAKTVLENESVKRELRAVTRECEKAEEALRQVISEQNDAYLLNKSDIELRSNSAIEKLNESLNTLTESNKAEIAHLQAVMHDRLTEGHVDEKLLTELETAAENAQKRVDDMIAHTQIVAEYKTWISQEGSTLGDERLALAALKRELSENEAELKDSENEMKYVLDGLKRELESATNQVHIENENLSRIKALENRLSDLGIKATTSIVGDDLQPAAVISDVSAELISFASLARNLKEYLDDISSTMAKFPQNVICACWEQARDPQRADCDLTDIEDYEQRKFILDTAAARVLIESTLPAQKRNLIDNARNISHMITEYYHHLKEFDARIKAFSGRISEIVQRNLQFEAFDSFNVRLEPCISRVAGWDSMQEIAEYYASWEGSGGLRGELPSIDFTNKMLDFARRFVNGQLRNEMSDLFSIVFEVVENGKFKRAQSARELEELSSNGLTFLLMCALYISLINETRSGRNIKIHWPVDEMSKLSGRNIHILLDIMDKNNIAMVSAAPDLSTAVAVQFRSIYRIAKDGVYVNAEAVNPVGVALQRHRNRNVASINEAVTQLLQNESDKDTRDSTGLKDDALTQRDADKDVATSVVEKKQFAHNEATSPNNKKDADTAFELSVIKVKKTRHKTSSNKGESSKNADQKLKKDADFLPHQEMTQNLVTTQHMDLTNINMPNKKGDE